jgi:RHS repeat-associated protein
MPNAYRYGFNGKEKDNSFSSSTSYDYGFRIYDPVIARFKSRDPLSDSYPMLTPYQFASNTPISAIDLDGLEATFDYSAMAKALKTYSASDVRSETHKQMVILSQSVKTPKNAETWTDIDVYKNFSKEKLYQVKESFVKDYKEIINRAAEEYDIPPGLLAGVAFNEFGGDPPSIDDAARAVRIFTGGETKTSFGDLSMQIRVAGEVLDYEKTTIVENNVIVDALKDTKLQFFIVAKHLSDLKKVDFSDKKTTDLTNEDIEVIGARYNRGAGLSLDKIKENLSYGKAITKRKDKLEELIKPSDPPAK